MTYWRSLDPALKRLLFIAILTGCLTGGVELLFTVALQIFLYGLKITDSIAMDLPADVPTSFEFGIAFLVAIGFVRAVLTALKIFVSRLCAQTYCRETRTKIIHRFLQENQQQLSSSKIISLFSDETTRAGNSLINFSTILIASFNGLTVLISALVIAPKLLGIGLALLIALAIPYLLLTRMSSSTGGDISKEWQRTNDRLISGLRNHFFLSVYGLLGKEKTHAGQTLNRYFSLYKKFILITSIKFSAPIFMGTVVIAGISLISVNYAPTPGPTLLSFIYLFLRFVQAGGEISASLNDFKIHSWSLRQINTWLKENQQTETAGSSLQMLNSNTAEANGNIESLFVENMNFSYNTETDAALFKNFDLHLRKDDCLVITGESGSGKSTLLSIMLGLLQPQSGKVLVNETPVEEIRPLISAQTGYVGPTPYLIEGTFRENLLYGHLNAQNISENDIKKALEQAELSQFTEQLSQGLETPLNEIASTLSTGQKQRLTLARAFLRNPSILILDEATSNLDQETESRIIKNLSSHLKGRITLIVSHRPALTALANKNIKLQIS